MIETYASIIVFYICPIAAIVIMGSLTLKIKRRKKRKEWERLNARYTLKRQFLTPAELRLYHALIRTLPPRKYAVNCKPRLADVFEAPAGEMGMFNRIAMKHIDFLITDRLTMQPLMGIELDDSSHETTRRKQRDEFIDALFDQAKIEIMHLRVKKEYDLQELHDIIIQRLES